VLWGLAFLHAVMTIHDARQYRTARRIEAAMRGD
jgi:hypothetical protein